MTFNTLKYTSTCLSGLEGHGSINLEIFGLFNHQWIMNASFGSSNICLVAQIYVGSKINEVYLISPIQGKLRNVGMVD